MPSKTPALSPGIRTFFSPHDTKANGLIRTTGLLPELPLGVNTRNGDKDAANCAHVVEGPLEEILLHLLSAGATTRQARQARRPGHEVGLITLPSQMNSLFLC